MFFHTDRGLFRAVDGIDSPSARQDRRTGGRIGLRQERDRALVMGLVATRRARSKPSREFDGRDILGLSAEAPPAARRQDVHDLPGADDLPQPGLHDRRADRRGDPGPQQHLAEAAKKRAIEMFELVRIPSAAERIDDYPHQLSGGMRQRVMIAMALTCEPRC